MSDPPPFKVGPFGVLIQLFFDRALNKVIFRPRAFASVQNPTKISLLFDFTGDTIRCALLHASILRALRNAKKTAAITDLA
jgi:hypothetical protein